MIQTSPRPALPGCLPGLGRWWAAGWLALASLSASPVLAAEAALPRRMSANGQPVPVEAHPGVLVSLGQLRLPSGERLRTLVTSPRGLASGRAPAVLVVGWLSCATVETPAEDSDGMSRLIIDLVTRSGARVWRVDKPGVGDSEGRCDRTDFETELQAYRLTFDALLSDPRTDPERIVVVGISNGGGVAPLVPTSGVAGFVSVGGWSGTWLEHAVWQERRRLELQPAGTEPINERVAKWQRLYAGMLMDGHTPGEMTDHHPELAPLWRWSRDGQYGRPIRFYQQLQRLDLAAVWSRVKVPTLAVWGSRDDVMSREESERLVALINRGRPAPAEPARLVVVPGASHDLMRPTGAATGTPGEVYAAEVGDQVVAFVRRVTGQPTESVSTPGQTQHPLSGSADLPTPPAPTISAATGFRRSRHADVSAPPPAPQPPAGTCGTHSDSCPCRA